MTRLRPIRSTLVAVAIVTAACQSDSAVDAPKSVTRINRGVLVSAHAPSVHQQETTLARSPNGRLVIVWIGWTSARSAVTTIEYTISDDDGMTWTPPLQIPIPPTVLALSDPGLAVDANGNFTLVALGDGPNMGVFAYGLAAGGTRFGDPTVVATASQAAGTQFDKTWIVPTASGLLITTLLGHGADSVGLAATSRDGVHWMLDTISAPRPIVITPCADGDDVTAVYTVRVPANGVMSSSSSDGGVTWAGPILLAAAAKDDSSIVSCVRHGAQVSALIPQTHGFELMESADAGKSYSVRASVTNAAAFPQLTVDRDGSVDVAFYDERQSTVNSLLVMHLAPGSTGFTAPDTIRAGMLVPSQRYGINGIADYIGGIPGYWTFTDNGSDTSHIAFLKLSR